MKHSASLLRLIAVLLPLWLAGPAAGQPKDGAGIDVSFTGQTIRASGITRGGEVIIFAATIGRSGNMQTIGRVAQVVTDADGDGAVDLTLPAIPVTSVWAVVDFATGKHAVTGPPGFTPPAMNVPPHGWQRGLEHFDIRREYLEVLVVRPGVGAWTLRVAEGGSNDDDGTLNTVLRTRLSRMTRLHGAEEKPRPPVVIPRDFLLIVDPHELDFFASEAR